VRHGITGTTPACLGGGNISFTVSHRQQRFGPGYMAGWFTVSTGYLFKYSPFFLSENTEGVFLSARHSLTPLQNISTSG
jgi:hypothetical protein